MVSLLTAERFELCVPFNHWAGSACRLRFRIWQIKADHSRVRRRIEVGLRLGRPDPFGAAVLVAYMLVEEVVDAIHAQVGNTILPGQGEDHGVRKDDLIPVDTALEVAEKVFPLGDVVAEV